MRQKVTTCWLSGSGRSCGCANRSLPTLGLRWSDLEGPFCVSANFQTKGRFADGYHTHDVLKVGNLECVVDSSLFVTFRKEASQDAKSGIYKAMAGVY